MEGSFLGWLVAALDKLFSTELVSAFIGAVIGGLFTMVATERSHRLGTITARTAREAGEAEVVREQQLTLFNTSQLILVEILTAWSVFREEYGAELMALPPDTPYVCSFPLGDNPFPLFDSAPECLAQLPPAASGQIVRFYMRAKGMVSMIKMNNADTAAVHAHARDAFSARRIQLSTTGISKVDMDMQLQKHFDEEATRMATFLGMGDMANAMKNLTNEVEIIVTDLKAHLAQVYCPPAR
jgi:hypothetical protein